MDALVRIPDKEIKEYQNIVESHKDDPTITFIEKVEALERFGISLLYKVSIYIYVYIYKLFVLIYYKFLGIL